MLSQGVATLVRDWEASARAWSKMSAILRQTGLAADLTTREAQQLATQIQKMTGASDEATASAIGLLAAQRNIRGDNLRLAAWAAADLAEGMKESGSEVANVESAARMLGMALADPERGISRLSRAGIKLAADVEKQAKAMARAGEIGKAQALILDAVNASYGGAAAAANKATGGLSTLRQTIGDVREAMGTAITNSDSFRGAVERIQKTAERLIASGAIELWAARVKERIEALLPVLSVVTRGIGALLTASAEMGAFAGGVLGGQSVGEAWAGRKDIAAESRGQAERDLAAQRARIAREADAQDRAERAAAEASLAKQRQEDRREAQGRLGAHAKRVAALATPGAPALDTTALQEKIDTAADKASAAARPVKLSAELDLESLGPTADDAIAQVRDRLAGLASASMGRMQDATRAVEQALDDLDTAATGRTGAQKALDALADRAAALEPLRERIAELRKEMAATAPTKATIGSREALAESPAVLAQARENLRAKASKRDKPLEYSMAGPLTGGYAEPTIPEIQREARRLADQATPQQLQTQARDLKAAQSLAHERARVALQRESARLAAEEAAIASDRTAADADLATREAANAQAEKALALAKAQQAAEEARLKQLEAAGKAVDKAAADAADKLADAADEADRLAKMREIDIRIRQLDAYDPLLLHANPSRREQVASFSQRAEAKATADRQDQEDAAREADLRDRLASGRHVSRRGMEFLQGREKLTAAEKEAADIQARKDALEKQKATLQQDSNRLLREIKNYLKSNLEAS